jgi:hypothetical protein
MELSELQNIWQEYDKKISENLAGLVELVDREEERSFVSFAELQNILSSAGEPVEGSREISAKRHRGRRQAANKNKA